MDSKEKEVKAEEETPRPALIVVWVNGEQVLMPADSIYIPYFAREK